MRLWRLSSVRRARDFNGGYGLANDGRWNTQGRPVTYCSTVPSLCALEKRVHVRDAGTLPALAMVEYDVPDDLPSTRVEISDLSRDWRRAEAQTRMQGDRWLDGAGAALLYVPSVIMPFPSAPDRNVLINHRHPGAARITIAAVTPFAFDLRLF